MPVAKQAIVFFSIGKKRYIVSRCSHLNKAGTPLNSCCRLRTGEIVRMEFLLAISSDILYNDRKPKAKLKKHVERSKSA